MKTITDRLWNAIVEVAKLRYPSVGQILRKQGYQYEAGRIDELTAAFDEMQRGDSGKDLEEGGGEER